MDAVESMVPFSIAMAVGTIKSTSESHALNALSAPLMHVSVFSNIVAYRCVKNFLEVLAHFLGEPNGNCVPNLRVLWDLPIEVAFERISCAADTAGRAFAAKLVPIGEHLEARPFPYSEYTRLGEVYIIVG